MSWKCVSLTLIFLIISFSIVHSKYFPPHEETDITVIDYKVELTPDIPKSYTGSINLRFRSNQGTKSINMNWGPYVTVTSAFITDEASMQQHAVDVKNLTKHKEKQLVMRKSAKTFEYFHKDYVYKFTATFEGTLAHDEKGFFVSSYIDKGVEKYYAATAWRHLMQRDQSKEIHRFFPYYKSITEIEIDLTVHTNDNYVAIASAGMLDTENPQKKAISLFLFGLFISKFQSVSNTNGTIELTAYLPHETEPAPSQSIVVLDIGSQIIEQLGNIFTSTEILEKIAYVILPDTQPNLLDSWNLVYYHGGDDILGVPLKEILIIPTEQINDSHISPIVIHKALLIVAKKNIIQFIGLRSLLRADEQSFTHYYWIEDGLADFLKYQTVGKVLPQFDSREMIYLDYVQPFLWQNFVNVKDTIPVTRMTSRFVATMQMFCDFLRGTNSPEIFDEFLKKIPTLSVTPGHFTTMQSNFIILFNEYSVDSQTIDPTHLSSHDTWMDPENGFPVVTIKLTKNANTLNILQENFYTSIPSNFYIPFILRTAVDRNSTILSIQSGHMATTEIEVVLKNNFELLFLNYNRSVTYRVNYPYEMWEDLATRLQMDNFGGIPAINRAQLIDDIMVLTLKGWHRDLTLLFNMFNYLSKETELLPWNVAARHLKYMYLKFRRDEIKEEINLGEMIREKVTPILSSLGFRDKENRESLSQKKLRSIIIELACMAKVPKCIEEVHKIIEPTKDPYRELNVNLRDAICCAAVRQNESPDFLNLLTILKRLHRKNSAERLFYMRCLSCSPSEQYLIPYIEKTDPLPGKYYLTETEIQLAQQYALENVDYKGVWQFERYVSDIYNFAEEKERAKRALKGWIQVLAIHARSEIELDTFKEIAEDLVQTGHLDASDKDEQVKVAKENVVIYQRFRGYLNQRRDPHIINK